MLDWKNSLMRFDFATATKISFGPGVLKELRPLIGGFGSHALVVTGRNPRHRPQSRPGGPPTHASDRGGPRLYDLSHRW